MGFFTNYLYISFSLIRISLKTTASVSLFCSRFSFNFLYSNFSRLSSSFYSSGFASKSEALSSLNRTPGSLRTLSSDSQKSPLVRNFKLDFVFDLGLGGLIIS